MADGPRRPFQQPGGSAGPRRPFQQPGGSSGSMKRYKDTIAQRTPREPREAGPGLPGDGMSMRDRLNEMRKPKETPEEQPRQRQVITPWMTGKRPSSRGPWGKKAMRQKERALIAQGIPSWRRRQMLYGGGGK